MFFYITDQLLDFLPLLMIFIFLNFFLGGKPKKVPPQQDKGQVPEYDQYPEGYSKRRPGEQDDDYQQEGRYDYDYTADDYGEYEAEPQPSTDRDLAAEFERALHKQPRAEKRVYVEPEAPQERSRQPLQQVQVAPNVEVAAAKRKRAAHPRLVQGLIMAEVLGKPRGLRPYGEERQ